MNELNYRSSSVYFFINKTSDEEVFFTINSLPDFSSSDFKPINIPDGVVVGIKGNLVNVKGKLGELSYEYQSVIKINLNDNYRGS